jgi:hypothetical protein
MKNWLIMLGFALAAAMGAYAFFFVINDQPEVRRAARARDAMQWLRVEYRLDDAQWTLIKQLHEAYDEVCGRHCAAILAARERAAPTTEVAALERVCVDGMTTHFKQVAALMPADQGERYLAMVLPKVVGYDHAGAPTVRVQP